MANLTEIESRIVEHENCLTELIQDTKKNLYKIEVRKSLIEFWKNQKIKVLKVKPNNT